MKFVYVLVSSEIDFYADQCAISIYSLKKYNKDVEVYIICDIATFEYIKEKDFLINQAKEILPVEVNACYENIEKSRFLKTSVRQIIDGDFLYIDTDTIITGNLEDLSLNDCEIGAVKVQDSDGWSKDIQHKHFKKYNKIRNLPEDYNYGIDNYFNSGVIYCKDTEKTRDFYKTWHQLWLESCEIYKDPHDQCDFDRTNSLYDNIVKDIDGKYNLAAIYPIGALRFLNDCRIFHYFTFSKKLDFLKIKDPKFLMKLRKKKNVSEVDFIVENIKNEYLEGLNIKMHKEPFLVRMAEFLNSKYPKLNSFLEKGYNIFRL